MVTIEHTSLTRGKNILFLDGECLLCQKSARMVNHLDKHNRIHFASLQGETAGRLPKEWTILESDQHITGTAVLAEHTGDTLTLWRGTDAILRTLKIIGGVWSPFWLLSHLPKRLKNSTYSIIARNRYRLGKKQTTCSITDHFPKTKILP